MTLSDLAILITIREPAVKKFHKVCYKEGISRFIIILCGWQQMFGLTYRKESEINKLASQVLLVSVITPMHTWENKHTVDFKLFL